MTASGGPEAGNAEDGVLLAAAARRNGTAFAAIVSRHYRAVYRLVWRMTAGHADSEDIAQEAFIKLWQNPAQVREGRALRGWLMRVAANGAIDRLRKRQTHGLDLVTDIADAAPLADAGLAKQGAAGRIDRLIAQLPDRQRLALSLVYFEGLSNIEAARAMETSIEAVESLLSRARRSLKEEMAGEWRELLEGLSGAGE